MKISLEEIAKTLKSVDNVVILIHHFPDGDTIGCGFALCRALQNLGKKARVECADEIGEQYGYITENFVFDDFEPDYVIAVDVAAKNLLGDIKEKYQKIDLCIDHHATNDFYANKTFVDAKSAAACEIVYEICRKLGGIDLVQASALYTGISTDTGCFKFSNTTSKTHRIAADLMEMGVDYAEINRIMFDTKSVSRMQVEKDALNSIKFFCGGKVAIMTITKESRVNSGAKDSELEGITGLPRTIEGVVLGITIRERDNTDICKISARSNPPVSASDFCTLFGGGGHERAAGCEINEPKEKAFEMLKNAAEKMFEELGIK